MAGAVGTSQLYATEVQYIAEPELQKLQTTYVAALWRSPNNFRCRETLLALFSKSHTGDPWSGVITIHSHNGAPTEH